MASFGFSGPPTTTGERDVRLSDTERSFLGFLLYQYGDTWIGDAADKHEEWVDWADRLSSKLD